VRELVGKDGAHAEYAAGSRLRDRVVEELAGEQELGEELVSASMVEHADVIVPDVKLPAFLDVRIVRKIAERVPVEPMGRGIERLQEPFHLLVLVVSPRRVARLGDPDLRPRIVAFQELAQLSDLWAAEIKAVIFGAIAAIVACHKGLNAKGGPKGVGDAVNQSVVITFMLLFVTNFVLTAVYFQLVPQKG
jgi:hypothetical protein